MGVLFYWLPVSNVLQGLKGTQEGVLTSLGPAREGCCDYDSSFSLHRSLARNTLKFEIVVGQ